MPASPRAFEVLAERIRRTSDPATVDMLLDQWLAYRDRATEWDAARWGFDPHRWFEVERAELARRARMGVGSRPIDQEGTFS
ncbi:hypothetical protein [Streptomyces sp. NBC_01373]|uniref:hypothetical protein n=1 Tax=Streptomyces sp. NBC_01373 TaxID=2903843 RepID=UPI002258E283|nr:hypothetical protein [Streptomyces sp. NBC_01373]MCX4705672.1 hypothetical protein [Streptomyces sp. NBC_01373]